MLVFVCDMVIGVEFECWSVIWVVVDISCALVNSVDLCLWFRIMNRLRAIVMRLAVSKVSVAFLMYVPHLR